MTNIKPIETIYNDYRFRSRLEARWAVFFDAAGIEYQYEPEGFDLGGLGYYLPDFYLPWFRTYVEIKPKHSADAVKDAIKKLEALFEETSYAVMLCIGDPVDDDMRMYCNDTTDDSGGGPNGWKASFLEDIEYEYDGIHGCESKHHISIVLETERDRDFWNSKWEPLIPYSIIASRKVISSRSNFFEAKKVARQSRFEHGETPKVERLKTGAIDLGDLGMLDISNFYLGEL